MKRENFFFTKHMQQHSHTLHSFNLYALFIHSSQIINPIDVGYLGIFAEY